MQGERGALAQTGCGDGSFELLLLVSSDGEERVFYLTHVLVFYNRESCDSFGSYIPGPSVDEARGARKR